MFIIEDYPMAVFFCVITMLCWGSWANTQKATTGNWRFELYNWDFVLGILMSALLFALTLGSYGDEGRSFLVDIKQADSASIFNALLGGVLFNAANILLVAAIAIAGMSVAFSVGMGFALILGVVVNYIALPIGNSALLFSGVGFILLAMGLNANAYKKSTGTNTTSITTKGLVLSLGSGLIMGFFYKFVIASMFQDFHQPLVGKISPYTAIFIFALGVFLSNFLFNTIIMIKPLVGTPIHIKSYFASSKRNHVMGVFGGVIWCLGMLLSVIASNKAGAAISYGLSSGATVVAAIWGIYIWKEFKNTPKGTSTVLNIMMACYIIGLGLIILAK